MSHSDSSMAPSGVIPSLPVAAPLPTIRPATASAPKAAQPRAVKQSAAAPALAADAIPPLPAASDYLDAAPAWLISAIVHMLLVIILGLWMISTDNVPEFILSLSVDDTGGEDIAPGDIEAPFSFDEQPMEPGESLEPLELESPDATSVTTESMPVAALGLETVSEAPAIQSALLGRTAGMKDSLLRAYGGTSATENAVSEALRWLARNQRSSPALWSLTGNYSDGANAENPDAATAMALLAFQGAGYTPMSDRKDPFTKVVTKGWSALLKRQNKDGSFFQEGSGNSRLYTHALCTIALCELYGMTKDTEYRDAAQKAVDYCVKIQAAEGGWRYQPGFDSDLSVTGWFVMALQSARMAGLQVDGKALERVRGFLGTVSLDGGAQYAYVPQQGIKLSMTAEGLLCRQYLGWQQADDRLQRGVRILTDNVPSMEEGRTHVYYWYYAAQVCHHMESISWRKWNGAMREVLPALQIREGKERGSWDPTMDDTTGVAGGGRLFVTCLATYCLEVYYRHLPLYQMKALSGASH